TSVSISGRIARAVSSRCLPIKHHGQTTSDTTSIGSTGRTVCCDSDVDMTKPSGLPDPKVRLRSACRNRAWWTRHSGKQGPRRIVALESRDRHSGIKLPAIVTGEQSRMFEYAGDPPRHHMGGALVGFRERDQNRAIVVAATEIDPANQSGDDARRVMA